MVLTEALASKLIAKWTKDCARIVPASPTSVIESRFSHPRIIVQGDFKGASLAQVKERALGLRRAMEGLNALACCVGFDPEENPSFWQREVHQLARDSAPATSLQRLSSDLFSRFDVMTCFDTDTPSTYVACGIASCLSDDPASSAMNLRRQVHAQLRRFLLSTPPPLDVIVGSSDDEASATGTSEKFLKTIHDLTIAGSLEGASTLQKVRVVVGREHVPVPLTAYRLFNVLRSNRVDVVEFHGTYHAGTFDVENVRAVLTLLCGSTTLEAMTWVLNAPPSALLIALYSSLPHMRSLQRVTLTGFWRDCPDWFAFALKSRQLRGLTLALSMNLTSSESKAVVDMAHDDDALTFACLLPHDVCAIPSLEYFQVGTSAVPVAGATLTQKRLVPRRERRAIQSDGHRLDVVARCRNWSLVVVPAYGLMWVPFDALGSWQRPLDRPSRSVPCGLRSLAYVHGRSSEIAPIAHALGACNVSAVSATVGSRWKIPSSRMEAPACVCLSSLQSLEVPAYEVDTLTSIVKHPMFGHCPLESLAVSEPHAFKQLTCPSPFFDAVTQRSSPLWYTLRELSVESLDLSMDSLENLAASLAGNRRLRFVRVRTSVPGEIHERLRQQFAVAIGPTDRSKVSLYSFLLSTHRSLRWQLLPSPGQRLVVAFAAVPARRQVVFLPLQNQ